MLPEFLYSNLPALSEHKVWAEINTASLKYNFQLLRSLTCGARQICTVKADAYGHSTEICVRALLEAGCDFFAVSSIEEAIAVRKICEREKRHADVLILGFTYPSQADLLFQHDVIQTVLSLDYAVALNREATARNCKVRTHIALDTGMNRVGICAQSAESINEAIQSVKKILQMPALTAEGLFTHFAKADEDYEAVVLCDSHTKKQFARFLAIKQALEADGIRLFCHVCNSAAAVRFPEFALDGVRLGILLYGVSPSRHIRVGTLPVLSLHTVIAHIHTLPSSETVGYGGKYQSFEDRLIATLPLGYADGLQRAFQGFHVTVQTHLGNFKAPIVGRICMDQCMIDVTGLPVEIGDKVTVFGCAPADLSTLAQMANTIEYEILCLISARVPRLALESCTDLEEKPSELILERK